MAAFAVIPQFGSQRSAARVAPRSVRVRAVQGGLQKGKLNEIASVEDFDELMEAGGKDDLLIVCEFYAKWCRKCISMMPRFRKLSMEYEKSLCGKVDINNVGKLPRRQGIKEMPTFQFFKGGEKVGEVIGRLDSDGVEKELREIFAQYGK